MDMQGLTKRHVSLRDYLNNTVKLAPETWRFGDTHGSAAAVVGETQLYSADFSNRIAIDEDLQLESGEELDREIERQDAEIKGFEVANNESNMKAQHEYVLHLIIANFVDDLMQLLNLLLYWMATERQAIGLDWTLKWNNNNSADLHLFFEIEETSKGKSDSMKTC